MAHDHSTSPSKTYKKKIGSDTVVISSPARPNPRARRQGLVVPNYSPEDLRSNVPGEPRLDSLNAILIHGVEVGIDTAPASPDQHPQSLSISRTNPRRETIIESPLRSTSARTPGPQVSGSAISTSAHVTRAPLLTYEAVMWIIHVVLIVVACVDRFSWNIWPRQNFTIGSGGSGTDKKELLEGPWSVQFYDICARVSGRFSIIALNLMLFARLRTVENWLGNSWINKYVADCSNIVNANLRLHIWNGIAMSVLMLVHVWSILLPCVVHGFEAQVLAGAFEWPLSERKPAGFKDADAAKKMMSLQTDDVFRICEMTILFGILAPLSYYWFWRKWHLAIHIHRIMAVVFCIDIVRRHTHPHSMILNTPFYFAWMLDKVVFAVWNHYNLTQFHRIMLGDDYMVLLWKSESKLSKTIGPNFYLKLQDSSLSENPHAFTAFQNRRDTRLSSVPGL